MTYTTYIWLLFVKNMYSHVWRSLRVQQRRQVRRQRDPVPSSSPCALPIDPSLVRNQSYQTILSDALPPPTRPLSDITNLIPPTHEMHHPVSNIPRDFDTAPVTPHSPTTHSTRRTFEVGESSSTIRQCSKRQRRVSSDSIPIPMVSLPEISTGIAGILLNWGVHF